MRRLLLLLIPCFALIGQSRPDTSLATRTKGQAKAPVTVYEMSDFQCPYCRRFAVETFPTIEKEYINTGKVKWIFINSPIPSLHANAVAAAEFAVCASRQGKFWVTHDLLYKQQETWGPIKNPAPYFASQFKALGLTETDMLACLKSGEAAKVVKSDAQGAARTGATSTPSFYIDGGMMSGAYPIGVWRQVLDSVVKTKTAKKP